MGREGLYPSSSRLGDEQAYDPYLVRLKGVEPSTSDVEDRCSIQLSYRRRLKHNRAGKGFSPTSSIPKDSALTLAIIESTDLIRLNQLELPATLTRLNGSETYVFFLCGRLAIFSGASTIIISAVSDFSKVSLRRSAIFSIHAS